VPVTSEPTISLVCFGLVGTLVTDEGIVQQSFAEAIATQGVVSGTSAYARRMTQVHQARGRTSLDVLRTLFPDNEARAQAAELAFEKSLADAMGRTESRPVPEARAVLDHLAAAGCRLCVMTSLTARILDGLLGALGWREVFDVALSADDVRRGFPAPDYALTAMLRVGVGDVRELAMVHSTGAGVECGRRAGANMAVGVLTGPHSAARLRGAGATHVIRSISELPSVLGPAVGLGLHRGRGSAAAGPSGSRTSGRGTAAEYSVPVSIPSQAPPEHRS
jgi:phosphoglycolate phosphatase